MGHPILFHGDSLKSWIIAVVVVEVRTVCKWLAEKRIVIEGDDIVSTPRTLRAPLERDSGFLELIKVKKFNRLEKIKKVYLNTEPFSMKNDILTPTMKIKRNIARKLYAP